MEQVKVSSKIKFVIPKTVREEHGISPDLRLRVLAYADRIELLPVSNVDKISFSRRYGYID